MNVDGPVFKGSVSAPTPRGPDLAEPCHVQPVLRQSSIIRALFCQEITEAIFSHLSLDSEIFSRKNKDYLRDHHVKAEQRERRRALASAARVSKYMSELALSVLWAQQLGFDHLFQLLPQYVSSWDRNDSPGLNGDPTDEQWATLHKYATLVRGVFYYAQALEPLEENLWKAILNHFGSISNFMPRLTELGVVHINQTGSISEPFLLSTTLRHLSVEFHTSRYSDVPDDGMAFTTGLQHIATAIPSLSSLNIDRGPEARISWTMPSFTALRNLDITPELRVDASVLAVIGQFQHLRTLSARITTADCAHLRGCLQSLTSLKLGGRAPNLQSFLAATAPPLLEHLSLFFMHDPSTEHLTQCISTALAIVPSTLSSLHLESSAVFNPLISSVTDVIRPALALRSLTHFTFKFQPLPSVSDADIATMLGAWPHLTALRIPNHRHPAASGPDDAPPPGSRPTASILPFIAAVSPLLRELVLPEVDLGATPTLDALPTILVREGHELCVLDLASRCGDRHACMRAAVMLDRLFPHMLLPNVRGDGYGDGEKAEKGWAAVVRLLGAMQAGRAHAVAFERVWGEQRERDGDGDGGGGGGESENGSEQGEGEEDLGEDECEGEDEDAEGMDLE